MGTIVSDPFAHLGQPTLERLGQLGMLGIVVKIPGFMRIVLHVVQLPTGRGLVSSLVIASVKVNELVALGSHAQMGGVVVVGHVHPVAVVGRFFPTLGFLARFQKGFEGTALDGLGDGGSRKVEHRGGVVGVLDDRVEALARLDGLGVPDEEGHAHGLFVHPTLVLVVVLAKHETLVAGVDDQGVVHLTGFFEVLEESTQVVVDALHATEKFLEVCVVGQACILFVGVVCGVVVCGEFLWEASGQITQVGPARVAVADRGADVRDQFILVSRVARDPNWGCLVHRVSGSGTSRSAR